MFGGCAFRLEQKITVSDIVAVVALIVSLAALFVSSRASNPYIVFGVEGIGFGAVPSVTGGECDILLSYAVEFNNSGQRSATLERISGLDGLPPVLLSKDGQLLPIGLVSLDVYKLTSPLEAIEFWPSLQRNLAPIDLDSPFFLSSIVPPNSAETLYFVVIMDLLNGDELKADRILVSSLVTDSAGGNLEIKMAMKAREAPVGC